MFSLCFHIQWHLQNILRCPYLLKQSSIIKQISLSNQPEYYFPIFLPNFLLIADIVSDAISYTLIRHNFDIILQSNLELMTFKISDQGIFQISKVLYTEFLSEKRLKQLDHDKIDEFKKLYIKPLYPHKQTVTNGVKVIQKYQCDQYCCQLDPGRFCCCSAKPPDAGYKEFGLGLCLYIKFLKHLSWFLFFVSLLSIVAIVLYEIVALQTGYNITGSYHNALFSTTIGTLSSQFLKCNYAKIQSNAVQFKLSCQSGYVSYSQPVFTNQTKSDLLNCRKESIKMNQKIFMPSYTLTSVTNTSLSEYNINVSISSDNYGGFTYKHMAYNYQCANSMYTLAGRQVPSQAIIFITVGIDLFIIICFLFFLISEHKAEVEEITYFKLKELAVNDFTLKVSGFRLGAEEEDLAIFLSEADKLRKRIDPNWQKNGNSLFNNVVQVKIPQIDEIKDALQLRRQYYEDMYDLIDLCFFEDGIDLYRYKDANDFIKKCYGSTSSPQYAEYRKRLQKLLDQFMSSKKVKFMDNQIQLSLLIAFTNPRDKKWMLKYAERNCFGPFVRAPNRKFYLSEPPIADMIIWENKTKFTCLRVIFAWVITLAICLGSYLLVAFATFQKQVLLKNNKFNVGCDLFYTSQQLVNFQQTLSDANKQTYLHCYCNYNYFSFDYKDANMRSTCSQWFSDFVVYSAIPILISFGIIVYNIVVDRIFRFLSKFQSHQYLSTQLYSYIIKRSFMLIMNMGLIIILIKLNYNYELNIQNLTFLFQGTYKDLTSDWYLQIGVIIILTLAFNIVIPIADMIFVSFVKCIRKCFDRQCYCVKTSQKTKKGYLELYLNDVFPIQSRYSDFIAMIIITMTFSAVMPILYIIGFLSIWFMFICDKLLLFKVYQKPINYSEDLQTKVFRIVYIAIMIHCVVTPFVLSQKYLMSAGANIQNNSRFGVIISTSYLIPYVVIFLLLAAWAIFHSTFVRAVSYCIEKCTKDNSKLYKSKLQQNFFEALNKYQINRLKMSLQLQLHSSIEHQKSKASQTLLKQICQNSLKKLHEADKALNFQNARGPNNIKLIGKAGYDEIFDDQIFHRDKKIKSLDYQFQDIFRAQRMARKANNVENTVVQLNF